MLFPTPTQARPEAPPPKRTRPPLPRSEPPPPTRRPPPPGGLGAYRPLLFFLLLAVIFVAGIVLLIGDTAEDPYALTPEERAALSRPPEARSARPSTDTFTPSVPSRSTPELRVESTPSGSLVLIDYEVVGRTPFYTNRLRRGWYLVSLEQEGYVSTDTLLYLTAASSTEIGLILAPHRLASPPEPSASRRSRPPDARSQRTPPTASTDAGTRSTGTIQIDADPAGAAVQLDGDAAGVTPLRIAEVDPGRHTLSFTRAGHEPQTRQIEVRPGETTPVTVTLEQQPGTLSVLVAPWGSIYVDGTLRARDTDLRYELDLPPGTHRIRAVHPELGAREQEVQIQPGRAASLVFDFNRRTP